MVTKDETPDNQPKAPGGDTPKVQNHPASVPDKAPDAQRPAAKTSTGPSTTKKSEPLNNDHGDPDPEQVLKATAKAEAARDKLAAKNAVSIAKDENNDIQGVSTEHFNVAKGDHYGIPVVNVSKRGYVGPAQLVLSGDEVGELLDALEKFE